MVGRTWHNLHRNQPMKYPIVVVVKEYVVLSCYCCLSMITDAFDFRCLISQLVSLIKIGSLVYYGLVGMLVDVDGKIPVTFALI